MRGVSLLSVALSGGEAIVSIPIKRVQVSKTTDIAGLATRNPGLFRLINRLIGRASQGFFFFLNIQPWGEGGDRGGSPLIPTSL
ncbi:hypothetical protein EDD16DRAFT_1587833 [Pisolithus croceorrhizus]|nr:hypothetical protein EDD16DRAFT_1587833 [Pisolithus croceorrhizus]KAI6144874.1 hypothetical protein EDD17DRAFT_1654977 [Pisolithus thermaeus]